MTASVHQKSIWTPWLVLLGVVVAVLLLFYFLGGVLTPFVIAAVLAYILNPLVERLQKHKVRRSLASMTVMLLGVFLLSALMLFIIPVLIQQFQYIVKKMPELVEYAQKVLLPWFNSKFGEYIRLDSQMVVSWAEQNIGTVQKSLQNLVSTLLQRGTALAMGLSNFFLLPFLLYYFLLDWEQWGQGLKDSVPRRYLETYNRITRNLDTVLSEFLRGQLTVMMIMGLMYGLGLKMVGLNSGFAIGMVAGLLVFVPYLGAFTGLLLATLAAILQFSSWHGLVMVWSVFAVGQFLESFWITPKIVGDRIGLSPFWVIFSLMAFGSLLGFIGMLAALPLAAICFVLLREGKNIYLNSNFYKNPD